MRGGRRSGKGLMPAQLRIVYGQYPALHKDPLDKSSPILTAQWLTYWPRTSQRQLTAWTRRTMRSTSQCCTYCSCSASSTRRGRTQDRAVRCARRRCILLIFHDVLPELMKCRLFHCARRCPFLRAQGSRTARLGSSTDGMCRGRERQGAQWFTKEGRSSGEEHALCASWVQICHCASKPKSGAELPAAPEVNIIMYGF